jgi:hypothetical protein
MYERRLFGGGGVLPCLLGNELASLVVNPQGHGVILIAEDHERHEAQDAGDGENAAGGGRGGKELGLR